MTNNDIKKIKHALFADFTKWLIGEGESLGASLFSEVVQESQPTSPVVINPVSATTGTASISNPAPSTATSVSPTH
jgi:hypothetical protein